MNKCLYVEKTDIEYDLKEAERIFGQYRDARQDEIMRGSSRTY